jgi:hypothetical protein
VEADEIAKRRRQRMIRIANSAAAYDAIRSTLPQDAPLWPVERQGGQFRPSGGPCADRARAIATPFCDWRR